jgi:carbamate kinase
VIRDEQDHYIGVEAVIDKDLAASLLARSLEADRFVISTAVDKVYLNYGKPDQRGLDTLSAADARVYMTQGHFARGSMLPKIEAMVEFVEATGKEGIITDPEHLAEAIEGKAGTHITP